MIVVLLIATVLSNTPSALACPCPELPGPLTSLERSTAVFSGEVIYVDEEGDALPLTGAGTRRVDFRVDRAWKGIERIRIGVHTESSSAACGYAFTSGKEYLVYAYGDRGDLLVSACSRTRTLVDVSAEELAALGEPTFLPEDEDWPPLNLIAENPKSSLAALAALTGLAVICLVRKVQGRA